MDSDGKMGGRRARHGALCASAPARCLPKTWQSQCTGVFLSSWQWEGCTHPKPALVIASIMVAASIQPIPGWRGRRVCVVFCCILP